MIVLGALLLAVAILVTVGVLLRATMETSLDLYWFTIHTTVAVLYVTGLVIMLLAVIGLWLMVRGLRREHRRRKEMQELRDRAARSENVTYQRDEPAGDQLTSADRPAPARDVNADDYFDSAPRESTSSSSAPSESRTSESTSPESTTPESTAEDPTRRDGIDT